MHFTLKPPHDVEDDYFRCLCGIHSHSYVLFISVMNLIVSTFVCIGMILLGQIYGVPIAFCSMLIAGLLLWGNRNKVWWAYIPELCLEVSTMIMNFVISIGVVFYSFFYAFEVMTNTAAESGDYWHRAGVALVVLLAGVLHIIFTLVYAYFVSVFARGFQYVRKINKTKDYEWYGY
ncbi:hypothetical protein M3Y99_01413200 [Aphelenchoides fujianensis]|nr:hypothetical protein M3Y99_01413200 [Aphelenchoides fujianensis]